MNEFLQRYNSLTQNRDAAAGQTQLMNPTALPQAPGMGSVVPASQYAPAGAGGYTAPSQGYPSDRRPATPPPLLSRESGAGQQPNYFPMAPASTPQLPMANPGAQQQQQQQQQSISAEFGPVLQQLKSISERYPEIEDIITQAAGGVIMGMNKLAAQFSQGGIPRSLV